jgi:hypothetical protein
MEMLGMRPLLPPPRPPDQDTNKRFDARLKEQMGATFRPWHLMAFAKSFAHRLVHRGLHEPGGNCLAMAIPLAIIWNHMAVVDG